MADFRDRHLPSAMSSRAATMVTELFAGADIRLDGARPWDLQIHDERFHRRVLAQGGIPGGCATVR